MNENPEKITFVLLVILDENVSQIVSNMLEFKFNMNNVAVQNAHRTGKNIIFQGKKQPKHIIFKVLYLTDKIEIMKKKRQCLLGENYYITDDLTESDLDLKKCLKPVMDDAKANKKGGNSETESLL